jgi:hypothetical protein
VTHRLMTQTSRTCDERLLRDAVLLKTIRMPVPNFSPASLVDTGVPCCDGGRLDGRTLALLEHVLVGSTVFSPIR